jgi:hypothetical protein
MKKGSSNMLITTLLGLIAVNNGILTGGIFGNLLFGFGVLVILYELALFARKM